VAEQLQAKIVCNIPIIISSRTASWVSFLYPMQVLSIQNNEREYTIAEGNPSHCNLTRLEFVSLNHSMQSSAVPDGWASCQAIALSSCK